MNFFINTKVFASGKDWDPVDKDEFEDVLGNLIQVLESLVFVPDSWVYYSSAEIESFLNHVGLIVSVYEYEYYELNYLRSLLLDLQGIDWSNQKFHKTQYDYILQLDGGYKPYSVSGTTLAEAAEYKHIHEDAIIIIVRDLDSVIDIYRRSYVFPLNSDLVKLDVLSSKSSIIKYFLENRTPPVFNYNPKHGENRSNVTYNTKGEPISPLKCSNEKAFEYLKKAIGYRGVKEVFFYDDERDEFIEFKPENTPDNRYHGYYPHNQEEIPQKVRIFLRENLPLFSIDP